MARKVKNHISYKKIIVCCEGPTENEYFDRIRKDLQLPPENVNILKPVSQPISIVKRVIEHVKKLKEEKRFDSEDLAWAVFDGDEHIAHSKKNWNEAIRLATKHGIKLAISNPSIELWYLLHFQDQNSNIHRNDAKSKLKKHVTSYVKGERLPSAFPNHKSKKCSDATARAKKLTSRNEKDREHFYKNPATAVYVLISDIKGIKNN